MNGKPGPQPGYAVQFAAIPGRGRTLTCPHWSVGNAVSAWCPHCGPLGTP